MEENTIELVMYVTWKDKIIKASDLIKQLLIEIEEKNKEIERLNNKLNKIKEKIKDLDISKIASRKELITPFIVNVLDIISEDEMSDKDE